MKITRLHMDENGKSRFEDIEIPSKDIDQNGSISDTMDATGFLLPK